MSQSVRRSVSVLMVEGLAADGTAIAILTADELPDHIADATAQTDAA